MGERDTFEFAGSQFKRLGRHVEGKKLESPAGTNNGEREKREIAKPLQLLPKKQERQKSVTDPAERDPVRIVECEAGKREKGGKTKGGGVDYLAVKSTERRGPIKKDKERVRKPPKKRSPFPLKLAGKKKQKVVDHVEETPGHRPGGRLLEQPAPGLKRKWGQENVSTKGKKCE